MELIFDWLNPPQPAAGVSCSRTFGAFGGVIGRGVNCYWPLSCAALTLSKQHALITFDNGKFMLIDISTNGTLVKDTGQRLRAGESLPIEHGFTYVVGDVELRATLVGADVDDPRPTERPPQADNHIPQGALFGFDLSGSDDDDDQIYAEFQRLDEGSAVSYPVHPGADYASITHEHLHVPTLQAPQDMAAREELPLTPEVRSEGFWTQFGVALGVDVNALDESGREALALKVAALFKQSIDGIQQGLHTRSALKRELRLAVTTEGASRNPLKHTADASGALSLMLSPGAPGQLPADQALAFAFRELQAHQVALLGATRAALRGALQHFSPQQLTLCFEREGHQPLFATAFSRWKAFERYHHALCRDDEWSERLLARDFARAYEEQVRLITTLHHPHQG